MTIIDDMNRYADNRLSVDKNDKSGKFVRFYANQIKRINDFNIKFKSLTEKFDHIKNKIQRMIKTSDNARKAMDNGDVKSSVDEYNKVCDDISKLKPEIFSAMILLDFIKNNTNEQSVKYQYDTKLWIQNELKKYDSKKTLRFVPDKFCGIIYDSLTNNDYIYTTNMLSQGYCGIMESSFDNFKSKVDSIDEHVDEMAQFIDQFETVIQNQIEYIQSHKWLIKRKAKNKKNQESGGNSNWFDNPLNRWGFSYNLLDIRDNLRKMAKKD